MPQRPQQEEIARNEHNQTIPQSWTERAEGEGTPRDKGRAGPVPEENRPGHYPLKDQDQPEGPPDGQEAQDEREGDTEDPTVEADRADPEAPGPGDSEG
jgi:hypothetical protein